MIFILTFDPYKVDANGLHNAIDSSPYISSWWHYLGSTYLLKSDHSITKVKDSIKSKWPNQKYLIMKVDPKNFSGLLPPKAWDWIRRNS
jgi:hypothetical protein